MRRFCPHCGAKLVPRNTHSGVPSYECPKGPHRAGDDDFRS